MIQSGGVFGVFLLALPQAMFLTGKEMLKKGIILAKIQHQDSLKKKK